MGRLSNFDKEALWICFDRKCWICKCHVEFSEMEIEHLLPKSLSRKPEKLAKIIREFGLPNDFDLFTMENLRPAHFTCNRAKSDNIVPIIAFEIFRGRSRARAAVKHAKRLSKRSNVSRALEILKVESIEGPLEPDVIENLQKIIAENLEVTKQHLDLNPKIPDPSSRNKTTKAFVDLEPLLEPSETHRLAMFFEAIVGLSNVGLPTSKSILCPAKYTACFRGVARPMLGEEYSKVFVFVQNPGFEYKIVNNHLKLLASPPNCVFVSYYMRGGVEGSSNLCLVDFEWVLADENRPNLPSQYSERYLERLW